MKKILSLILLSTILFACSNDTLDDLAVDPGKESKSESVPLIASYDDLNNVFKNDLKAAIGPPYHGLRPGAIHEIIRPASNDDGLEYKTVTGYDSYSKSGSSRVTFHPDFANQLGLSSGRIYQVHTRSVNKNVTVPNGYTIFENTSPECGYTLHGQGGLDFTKRGYSMGSGSTKVTLTTYIYFVECDEWSHSINKEYPCTASSLKWNYILWREQ